MRIDQRNAGASVTPTSSSYSIDRWQSAINVSSKFSIQQVTDAPTNATHSLKATSLSAYSIGASEICTIRQHIEGYNTAHLNWGTANAKTVTLSFWVKSSLTGTFGGSIMEGAAASRSYPFTYTINTADTWEQKTITISGDTTGTWSTSNTASIDVLFSLGAGTSMVGTANTWAGASYYGATGQSSLVATNAATWQVSLVQLEVGTEATPFEHRPYDMELARCQRYYHNITGGSTSIANCVAWSTTTTFGVYNYPTTMRAVATMTYSALADFDCLTNGLTKTPTSILSEYGDENGTRLKMVISGGVLGQSGWYAIDAGGGTLEFDAEL
jgi:hypothetical protein